MACAHCNGTGHYKPTCPAWIDSRLVVNMTMSDDFARVVSTPVVEAPAVTLPSIGRSGRAVFAAECRARVAGDSIRSRAASYSSEASRLYAELQLSLLK